MRHRILFQVTLTIMLTALGVTGVVLPTANATTATDKQVAAIRAEVGRINKGLAKLTKTTIPVDNVSLEGTEATYYRNGKTIQKIEAELLGETYQAKIDFYYSQGQLIFALDRHSKYKAGLGSPVEKTTVYRLYFSGGESIRVLAGTKRLSAEDASTEVDAIREISTELIAAIS